MKESKEAFSKFEQDKERWRDAIRIGDEICEKYGIQRGPEKAKVICEVFDMLKEKKMSVLTDIFKKATEEAEKKTLSLADILKKGDKEGGERR